MVTLGIYGVSYHKLKQQKSGSISSHLALPLASGVQSRGPSVALLLVFPVNEEDDDATGVVFVPFVPFVVLILTLEDDAETLPDDEEEVDF